MAEDVFGIVGSVIASAYRVESVVAEGGFGVVYRAHQGGFRAPVALKLLKVPEQDLAQQTAFLQLFRSEAELLLRLSTSSPTIVRALHVDAFTSRDGRFVPYLVLEWLEGITLETLIERRQRENLAPVSLRKLVRLLTPVARALERAHDFAGPNGPVSIVHGDLEPGNIFVAQVAGEEVVKLLDFGLGKLKRVASQVAGRVSQDGSAPLAFTPAHGAPEQWAPRQYGQTGPWTDVWGLALCMVEVMAGHWLIGGEPATRMGIALDPQRRPTPRTEGIAVSDAIEAVFARALALDPRARQRNAGAFWDELLAALERPESAAQPRLIETAEELEFDPTSARRPASVSARLSAPYSVPLSTPTRGISASRSPAPARPPGAEPAPPAAAVAVAHFVPDLELTPAPTSRRPSGERPVAPPRVAHPSLLELDDALLPPSFDLDLDLPADEPRAQRSVSSQRLAAVQPNAQRSSNPPSGQVSGVSGSVSAVREPLLNPLANGLASSRQSTPDLQQRADEAPRSARHSRPPPAEVSAPYELSFVAKIDPKLLQERTLVQRLRPAVALLGVAILVAILDPVYAAATGERLLLAGQRLSLLAGALFLLAIALGVRELAREQ